MARMRKPGAGRKPIGPLKGKTSTFSTRITAETRGALEAEAASSGLSISQAAERLLRIGLELKRDRELDDPVRALGYVIRTIDQFCRSTTSDGRDCDWRTDPSVFESFRLALATFLERLRPPGQIDASVEGPLVGRSPEQHGEAVFRLIWNYLQTRIEPRSISEIEAGMARKGLPLTAQEIAAIAPGAAGGDYAMLDVQRALNINAKVQK